MRKYNFTTGQKFGYLTVVNEVEYRHTYNGKKNRMIKCTCECGKERVVAMGNLVRDPKISCGCKNKWGINFYKHGLSKHPLMSRWRGIKTRCYDKKFKFYKDYGGRGIKVCDEWRDSFVSFYNWAMSNGFKENLELDRFPNNDGDYEPNNCRWATKIQNTNNTRASVKYEYEGHSLSLPEIARKENIHYNVLYARVKLYNIALLDAIQLAKENKKVKKGVVKGSMLSICKEKGISFSKMYCRMKYRKLTFEQTLKTLTH